MLLEAKDSKTKGCLNVWCYILNCIKAEIGKMSLDLENKKHCYLRVHNGFKSILEELVWLFWFDLLTQTFHKKYPQKIFIEGNNVQCKVHSLFLAIANKKKFLTMNCLKWKNSSWKHWGIGKWNQNTPLGIIWLNCVKYE